MSNSCTAVHSCLTDAPGRRLHTDLNLAFAAVPAVVNRAQAAVLQLKVEIIICTIGVNSASVYNLCICMEKYVELLALCSLHLPSFLEMTNYACTSLRSQSDVHNDIGKCS